MSDDTNYFCEMAANDEQLETMEAILQNGSISPNAMVNIDGFDQPLINLAVSNGSLRSVRLLLEYGADINVHMTSSAIEDPLAIAEQSGNQAIAQLLRKERNIRKVYKKVNDDKLYRLLTDGRKELSLTVHVKMLYELICDTDCSLDEVRVIMNQCSRTSLMFGLTVHPSHLLKAANLHSPERFELLVQYGTSVNHHQYIPASDNKDNCCTTPLMCAITHKMDTAVERLIKAGADINHITSEKIRIKKTYKHIETLHKGSNALHLAILYGNSYTLEYLVHHGADINQRNEGGYTPLHLACGYARNDMVQFMVAMFGGTPCEENDSKPTIDQCELSSGFSKSEIDFGIGDLNNVSILGNAIKFCDPKTVAKILPYFNMNCLSQGTYADPYYLAIANPHSSMLRLLLAENVPVCPDRHFLHYAIAKNGSMKKIETLLDNGCPPNALNCANETPLMNAARAGFPDVCFILMQYDADVNYKATRVYDSAFCYAFFNKYSEQSTMLCMKLLLLEGTTISPEVCRDNMLYIFNEINYWYLFFGTLPRSSIPMLNSTDLSGKHHGTVMQHSLICKMKTTPFALKHICRIQIRNLYMKKYNHGGTLSERIAKHWTYPKELLRYVLYLRIHPVLDGIPDRVCFWPEIFDNNFAKIYKSLATKYDIEK